MKLFLSLLIFFVISFPVSAKDITAGFWNSHVHKSIRNGEVIYDRDVGK